jgi:4-alpha-glucanotransferase
MKATRVAPAARESGLLLHLSSLPGPYGVGTLGREADAFVDFLARAGQSVWQMLPVNPIGAGDSPYSTTCSFAGEPLFIDLEALARRGWLKKRELAAARQSGAAKAHYEKARKLRRRLLETAYERAQVDGWESSKALADFRKRARAWLDDFTLFQALSAEHGTRDWTRWPAPLARREAKAMAAARRELAPVVGFETFLQAQFDADWRLLRERAHQAGVRLMGDLPIFVAHESSDVWANQSSFLLDASGRPTHVAGCPPDAFNADGQLWGNALYDWNALRKDGFGFWLRRLGRLFELFDSVRLDHFIGFRRYWKIPAKAKTARNGVWTPAPGDELFATIERKLGRLDLVAEDLGAVTPEVRLLRDKFDFPGMKVMQFAFDGSEEGATHRPHRFPAASVAYPGTHDNDTARGWYAGLRRDERAKVDAYFGASARDVPAAMIRAAMASAARLCVFPVQDVLGLDGKARMNVPGIAKGNWSWRLVDGQLKEEHAVWLRTLSEVFERTGTVVINPSSSSHARSRSGARG